MLHYTCDACGVRLDERRYVVKVEVSPAFDPDEIDEEDLDADHLEAIAEILADDNADSLVGETTREFRYDLCPHCREHYCRDPLYKDALRRLDFSEN